MVSGGGWCELYGRLLAMVVQHWALLTSCWAYPDRSLPKAAQTGRKHALVLAKALRCSARLAEALNDLARCIGQDVGSTVEKPIRVPFSSCKIRTF